MKLKWPIMTAIIVVAGAVLTGIFFDMRSPQGTMWFVYTFGGIPACVAVIVLGIYAVVKATKRFGGKGLVVAILLALVVVPLMIFGTCALNEGGTFLRRLLLR